VATNATQKTRRERMARSKTTNPTVT